MKGRTPVQTRIGSLFAVRRLTVLSQVVWASAILALGATAYADVVDVNPDGLPGEPRFGGRSLGITIQPGNASVVYVATEGGGFFSSADGGTTWTHIDDIPAPLARDILFDPQDGNVIIASGRYDARVANQGGIWRSTDGGLTWSKPATSNPGCSTEAASWGVAIPNDPAFHQFVYAATDCGIAISADSGATWTHTDPCTASDAAFCSGQRAYFDVEARVVGGQVQLDVCGDEGYFRSADGGANWSAPDPASPARQVAGGAFNPCRVATAPNDANTVYLANYSGVTPAGFCTSRLMENAAGGAAGSWTDMAVSADNCRDPWVVTHPDQGGDPDLFEVYFGDTKRVRRQVCDVTATPRCMTGVANWPTADSGSHSDTSDIAFDPAVPNGCPLVLTSDGGNAVSTDCGATWQDGNRGLHALDVVTFAGTLQAGGLTDLYAGTQDNGIYATQDNATTWARPISADGYNVLADRTAPARVFYRQCFGCSDSIANSGVTGSVAFTDPPGNVSTFAVVTQFGPLSYAFVTSDGGTPAQWTAYVTTDEGVTWTQLGPSPLPGSPGEIKASGPAANPTFYLRLNVAGQRRIYRLSGALDSTATLTLANAGLSFPTGAWDVDPSDPQLLYAADIGNDEMMRSTDGGMTWNADPMLTDLVTQDGVFAFSPNAFPLVSGVGIDPDSARIVVGTRTAGWYVSVTDGQAWLPIVGSELIPRAEEFFFDTPNNDIYAATRGRGIWRVDLPSADLTLDKGVAPSPAEKGESLTYTLQAANAGPDPSEGVTLTDTLPSGLEFETASGSCTESSGTVSCDLGDLINGASASVEITAGVSCALPDGAIVTNTASVTSPVTPDEDLGNNVASVDVAVFDTTPPVIQSLSVSPTSFWPPNHTMQRVEADVVATDTCDPSPVCSIVAVTSNEPVNGTGDGNTVPDWLLPGGLVADLRAERAGNGDGRTYTLTVECTDSSGNVSLPSDVDVIVPHDQRPN
jgi:uncharacterized repeat protein (TIGR01451 family)